MPNGIDLVRQYVKLVKLPEEQLELLNNSLTRTYFYYRLMNINPYVRLEDYEFKYINKKEFNLYVNKGGGLPEFYLNKMSREAIDAHLRNRITNDPTVYFHPGELQYLTPEIIKEIVWGDKLISTDNYVDIPPIYWEERMRHWHKTARNSDGTYNGLKWEENFIPKKYLYDYIIAHGEVTQTLFKKLDPQEQIGVLRAGIKPIGLTNLEGLGPEAKALLVQGRPTFFRSAVKDESPELKEIYITSRLNHIEENNGHSSYKVPKLEKEELSYFTFKNYKHLKKIQEKGIKVARWDGITNGFDEFFPNEIQDEVANDRVVSGEYTNPNNFNILTDDNKRRYATAHFQKYGSFKSEYIKYMSTSDRHKAYSKANPRDLFQNLHQMPSEDNEFKRKITKRFIDGEVSLFDIKVDPENFQGGLEDLWIPFIKTVIDDGFIRNLHTKSFFDGLPEELKRRYFQKLVDKQGLHSDILKSDNTDTLPDEWKRKYNAKRYNAPK